MCIVPGVVWKAGIRRQQNWQKTEKLIWSCLICSTEHNPVCVYERGFEKPILETWRSQRLCKVIHDVNPPIASSQSLVPQSSRTREQLCEGIWNLDEFLCKSVMRSLCLLAVVSDGISDHSSSGRMLILNVPHWTDWKQTTEMSPVPLIMNNNEPPCHSPVFSPGELLKYLIETLLSPKLSCHRGIVTLFHAACFSPNQTSHRYVCLSICWIRNVSLAKYDLISHDHFLVQYCLYCTGLQCEHERPACCWCLGSQVRTQLPQGTRTAATLGQKLHSTLRQRLTWIWSQLSSLLVG